NCDAEVDQMMVEFPIMEDYKILDAGNRKFFLTHGHLWNEYKIPPIGIADVLAYGHTHIPELKTLECGLQIFNPGSVSLPKGGSGRSIGYYDGEELKHFTI
ncbi:MAG: metallophosphoesterase family protein, partial [Kiritimatiellae bacterium]|nr:metallophosphoesterase family protein [Kiritimatiellia bacterium]